MHALEARDLGRRFLIQPPMRRTTLNSLRHWLRPASTLEPLWALREVNLAAAPGDCVALLGANGAGKSTLLSVLAGLLPPTEGTVRARGRVSPFLRLGAGLYGELSVRENLAFAATLFGLTTREAERRLEAVVEFGGLERYLDAALCALSSGYQARVAMSAALHSDLDILLIDEVFATGDLEFSRRCVRRMIELREKGRTFVLATHDLSLAEEFCTRALLLERGRVKLEGPAGVVAEAHRRAQSGEPAK